MRKIAVVSINKNKYSETFIHNHLKLLPARTILLYGGYLPVYNDRDEPFVRVENEGRRFKLFIRRGAKDKDTLVRRHIAKYLQREGVHAVLAEYGPSGVEMMDICRETGIPLVVHFHGYDAYRRDMMEAYGVRYTEMFEKAAAAVGVSKHMMNRLRELGAPQGKLYYIPYGPDAKLFRYHDAGANPPHFLAAGRFAETKSPHLAILAFNEVHKQVPEARLTIAGDGHLLEACKILSKALKLEDKIVFTGRVTHQKLSELMGESRAFVQHSVTTPENDMEGTPVAILEAGAAGLPVVGTLHAGIPDVVVHGETGYLVPEGDIAGMAEAMITLAGNAAMATEMGKKAHNRIQAEFSMEKHINGLYKVIEEAIENKK